jgi:2-keto-4-pentenoate hydratase/2-oxohepta-3-ene-1,7-dioic acid hydratase in catechol pathway
LSEFDPATGLAAGSFGVGTYRRPGERAFPGVVRADGAVIDVSRLYRDTHEIFEDWQRAFDRFVDLAAASRDTGLLFAEVECLPALAHPNLLGAGSNYRQHVAEMMTHNKFNQEHRLPDESDQAFFQRNLAEVDRRAREGMPFLWTGLHSSLSGANDDVVLPLIGENPDWELELGVVVSGTGRYLSPEEAAELIAGYAIVNDLGTVDEFRRVDIKFRYDWISKHQPSFKPFGPFVVPRQFVDRDRIRIRMKVNGETMQDWPVTDMIFSPEQMLSYASERVRLVPGDLLITGSPPGNAGSHGGRWLRPGDTIESELEFLGRQRNRVVAEDSGGRETTFGPFLTAW